MKQNEVKYIYFNKYMWLFKIVKMQYIMIMILFNSSVSLHSFILVFLQTLDYETKKSYTFKVEASNAQLDSRFLHLGPFKDSATVKVSVLDVEEPPVFTTTSYSMDVYEDTPPGTIIGSVTAHDLDASSSAVR